MIWQDLVKTALIGSDKFAPSVLTVENLQKMGIHAIDSAEIVLEGAGLLTLFRKSGYPLSDFMNAMPDVSEEETKQVISPKSARHLHEILFSKKNKHLNAVVVEFIFLTKKNNKILPYEFLPALFHFSRGNKEMSINIKSVIGKRGAWLAKQNPDWFVYNQDSISSLSNFTAYSKEETLARLKDLVEIVKSQSYYFLDNRKLNIDLSEFAYKADTDLFENVDNYLSHHSTITYQNKIQEILHTLRFRQEMIKELTN